MKVLLLIIGLIVSVQCNPISESKSEVELERLAHKLLDKAKFAKIEITRLQSLIRNVYIHTQGAKNYIRGLLDNSTVTATIRKLVLENVKVKSVDECQLVLDAKIMEYADDLKDLEEQIAQTEAILSGEIDYHDSVIRQLEVEGRPKNVIRICQLLPDKCGITGRYKKNTEYTIESIPDREREINVAIKRFKINEVDNGLKMILTMAVSDC